MNVQEIEAKVSEAVHAVLADVETHEPEIEQVVASALGAAGVPPELVTVATSLISSLKSHSWVPAPAPVPEPTAPPEPDPTPVVTDGQ